MKAAFLSTRSLHFRRATASHNSPPCPTLSGDNCASYDQGRLPKPDQPMHGRNDHKQRLRGITWLFPAHGMAETAGLPPLPKALKSLGGKGW